MDFKDIYDLVNFIRTKLFFSRFSCFLVYFVYLKSNKIDLFCGCNLFAML